MACFPTNRSLLNPKFEGYKLSPLAQDEHITRFPLTAYPTQANVSGRSRTPLSFEEVQSRITHNHLTISRDSSESVYVDDDLNVIRIVLNPDLTPTFSTLSELPKPIQSDDLVENQHREYPSAVSLGDTLLVSDGTGLLYVLSETREDNRIVALYHLPDDKASSTSAYTPFRLHAAQTKDPGVAVCVLSCRHVPTESLSSSESQTQKKSRTTKAEPSHFDVLLAEVSVDTPSDDAQPLKIIWKGRGDDVPSHVGYDTSRGAFFILGKSWYRVGIVTPPTYEPTPEELAPIPRAGEVLAPDGPIKPPPYSWTQTQDSVTVAFALPSNVPKSAIHVTLTAKTLSLLVKHELPMSASLPRYSLKQLWDGINPSSSFWTWDREAEREFGLLTLHLDKQHEGTRWAQVFASAGMNASSERTDTTDEEVPETLDPSELYLIREALEKYTSSLQLGGGDASGLGLGEGVPSLAEGELDDSVDSSVGRRVAVTWVTPDGLVPEWASSVREENASASVLSVPVPGLRESEPSLVIKSDIDGLLFTLPPSTNKEETWKWKHTSTYPALSFVLASKRDTRFTFHISSLAVLAFESGTSTGGGNVYIYRGSPGETQKSTWAKQAVLKVSGGTSGALLGVGALRLQQETSTTKDGFVLLCLCERELIVVKDIL
ncbi:uncharacterized protein FOMMEDRAFT_114955 [Fomitiporia mediterranea MF3/22]|uniref:uncharacterized protein n=1 Tax=Fomitiporia mediterranea (strain MF3/22) TaxID=694068 RepID=UPI0004407FCB|nr:uncharacterized protein FOMMEDRAFT_114955 [Fomitiporia mediterranea MF3/22]EJC98110.1 hypothetical protein FOMMEDRAFT_114955 [Fomitiporia mediterranea MF3/22]